MPAFRGGSAPRRIDPTPSDAPSNIRSILRAGRVGGQEVSFEQTGRQACEVRRWCEFEEGAQCQHSTRFTTPSDACVPPRDEGAAGIRWAFRDRIGQLRRKEWRFAGFGSSPSWD